MANAGNPATQQNVFQQSAGNLGAASTAAQGAAGYQPDMIKVGTAAGGMGNYQNPYQQQVIDNTMADMDRARRMAMGGIGARATGAGAFGGSRHGLVEAETNRNFIDRVGNMSAQLRQQGFNTALGASQFDVSNQMAAQQANQGAGLQGEGMRLNAAGTLGNLSNLGFGMGQQIRDNQMQEGTIQQALNQQLIDAAKDQYRGFTNAPGQSLQYPLAAIGAAPFGQTTETSQSPGLFNIMSLGLGLL